MKKILVAVASAVLCLGLFAGCSTLSDKLGGENNGGDKTDLERVTEMYQKLPEAKKIGQRISVATGELVQYESDKTFTKSGNTYTVTGTVRQLNALSSGKEEPYTTETVNETRNAGTFTVELTLDERYFSKAEYKNGVLTCSVKDGYSDEVFGLAEEFPASATPEGMKLEITTKDDHVMRMKVTYTSADSLHPEADPPAVSITLSFEY